MNFVILSGRLTRDPEIRYTDSKKAVVSFSVAVDDGKDRDGNRKTQFINCVAWEKTAEFIDEYFKKGDGINLTGKITTRTYEKDGRKNYVTEVVASIVEFPLSRKTEDKIEKPKFEEVDDDGELPF